MLKDAGSLETGHPGRRGGKLWPQILQDFVANKLLHMGPGCSEMANKYPMDQNKYLKSSTVLTKLFYENSSQHLKIKTLSFKILAFLCVSLFKGDNLAAHACLSTWQWSVGAGRLSRARHGVCHLP